MHIPRDWNDKPNPIPSGLLYSHNNAMQRLEKALAQAPRDMEDIRISGYDCMATSDFHGRQYFQMMMSF